MVSRVIWVVVFAVPPEGRNRGKGTTVDLEYIFNLRDALMADVMYENRHNEALAMQVGDRIVVHFGGPRYSHSLSQHLVRAGYVKEKARAITPADESDPKLRPLIALTRAMFTYGPITGIIFYQWWPPKEVGTLPRPYPPPKPGTNFIQLLPGNSAYDKVDEWWRKVVPRGHWPDC